MSVESGKLLRRRRHREKLDKKTKAKRKKMKQEPNGKLKFYKGQITTELRRKGWPFN